MRLLISAAAMLLAVTLQASAQSAVAPDVLKDLAPTGKLRAAINFGNSVLAQKGKDGEPQGVTADLSRELAKRLGVPVSFITFEAAGKVFEAAKAGAWDVGFVAEGGRRRRQAGHQDRGRRRLGLRPLPDAHPQERHPGARVGRRRPGDD